MPRPKSNLSQTVFVRYSPPNPAVTHTLLTSTFSECGPVKKCSVIRDQKHDDGHKHDNATNHGDDDDDDGGKSPNAEKEDAKRTRGYGFVRFASPEDAAEAVAKLHGTYLTVGEYGDRVKLFVERASDATDNTDGKKRGGKKGADVSGSKGKEDRPVEDDAGKEQQVQDQQDTQQEQQFQVDEVMARRKRTARIILRNLAFSAKVSHIRTAMESTFGKEAVVDVHLPLVPGSNNTNDKDNHPGKGKGKGKGRGGPMHRGFAFVTFDNAAQAQKAVEMGSLVIKGREVAMDYSVSKFQHKRMAQEEQHVEEVEENDAEDEEEKGMEEDEEDNPKKGGEGSSGDDSSDSNDDDDDGDNDSDSSSDDDDDGSDSEASDDDSEDDQEDDDGVPKEHQRPKPVNDPRRTLFVRNVPFDANRTDLFEVFRHYGRIESIYLVKDRDTGVGKGTAFVRYEVETSSKRALEAAGSSTTGGPFVAKSTEAGDDPTANLAGGQGLYLSGRRLLIDPAVDRDTASSLKVERDEDGKPLDRNVGKDRRNLYLSTEGRVAGGTTPDEPGPWEELPESDRLKRGRAHQEKSSKLRSPLFFVNPVRLSFRNLAKHVDEAALKKLAIDGIQAGLEADLVSKEDVMAHWRASGDMTARDIVHKISELGEAGDFIVPPYDEAAGIRRHIPSVYIDRDFAGVGGAAGTSTSGKKELAPSRGFGFVEFTHHAHALACLRELNNNPAYSAEYAAGGKKAVGMRKRQRKGGKKGKKGTRTFEDDAEGGDAADFVGDDGRVRIPRLIVEFTVENKAKARQQAEHRAHQLANAEKQRAANRAAKKERDNEDATEDKKSKSNKKKKGRGALQREKKRRKREEGSNDTPSEDTTGQQSKKARKVSHDAADAEAPAQPKIKGVKPPKKRKVDKEEQAFENMVRSYKQAFAGGGDDSLKGKKTRNNSGADKEISANPRAEVTKKRWFD